MRSEQADPTAARSGRHPCVTVAEASAATLTGAPPNRRAANAAPAGAQEDPRGAPEACTGTPEACTEACTGAGEAYPKRVRSVARCAGSVQEAGPRRAPGVTEARSDAPCTHRAPRRTRYFCVVCAHRARHVDAFERCAAASRLRAWSWTPAEDADGEAPTLLEAALEAGLSGDWRGS